MAAPDLLIPIDAAFLAELTARTAIKSGDVYWKIEIDDGGGYDDYTACLDNNQVDIQGSTSSIFKACEAATATFRFRNSPKIFSEGDLARFPIKISVAIGASGYIQIFTGYISDSGCERAKRSLTDDRLTISAADPLAYRGLKRKVKNQALLNYFICKTTDTSHSIAHHLATLMGLAAGDLEFIDILDAKDYIGLGGDTPSWDELQNLALQHGAYLGFRYDGKLRLIVWTAAEWAALTPEYTFDSTNVHEWRAVGGNIQCNKAKTEYMDYQALPAGSIIYKNYDEWDEILLRNAIEVAAGEYWPGGTDSLAVGRLNYGYGQEKYPIGTTIITPTIGAVGSGSDIQCSGGLLTLISFNGSTADTTQNVDSSEIILKNNTGSTVMIVGFQVRGTPIREKATIKVEHVDATVANEWEEVEREIPGKYAVSPTQAKITVRRWVDFGKEPRKRFEAMVDFTPHLQSGAIVRFNPNADVDVDCYIETYGHNSGGSHTRDRTRVILVERIDYSATGAGVVAHDEPTVPPEVVPPASINNPLLIDTNVIGSEHMRSANDVFGLDDELPADADEWFDFSQPDCLSHRGRKPEPGYFLTFEPAFIGQVENPRTCWADRSVLGAWKTAMQLLTYPEDWSQYDVERMATNPSLAYNLTLERQATLLSFAADAGKYKEYVQKRAAELGMATQYCFSALIYSSGVQTIYSKIDDELIDRGDCEDNTTPAMFGETSNILSNATWARDAAQTYENTYSRKFTKTIAAGTAAYITLTDAESTSDMHGLIAGQEYTLEMRIYIPSASGIQASEIRMYFYDYASGAWQSTSVDAAAIYDAWQKITVTRTIRAAATGILLNLYALATAALNEYFYVDLIKLRSNSEGACRAHTLAAGINYIQNAKVSTTRAAVYLSNHDIDAGGAGAAFDCYVINSQFEASKYATPFTSALRPASSLWYYYAWAQIGAIEGWFRPGFSYDVATDKYLISDYNGATVRIRLFYQAADDKFTFIISDGATTITLQSGAVGGADDDAKNTNLRKWTWFKIYWNTITDSYGLLLKSAYWDVTETSVTALNTISFSNYLEIGTIPKAAAAATYEWDGEFTDFLIYSAKDTLTGHYAVNRPWFDPNELSNAERSVRISRDGARFHNSGIILTDKYGRLENISNAAGLLVRDANGQIIHDIPNAVMQINSYPMGHLYIHKNNVTTLRLVNSAAFSVGSWIEDQAIITEGNTNIKGVRLKISLQMLAIPALTTIHIRFYLRPSGSDYGAGSIGLCPCFIFGQGGAASPLYTGFHIIQVLDVPIFDNKFDYYVDLLGYASGRQLDIYQLGIWA